IFDDRLEVRQRRADRKRKVLPAAQRDSHVFPKDWGPLLRRHCDEVNFLPAPVTDNGVAVCSLDILDPSGIRSEHGHQITSAFEGYDRYRVRASAAGCTTTHLKGCLKARRQPEAGPPTPKPVDPSAKMCRAPVAVKQPH